MYTATNALAASCLSVGGGRASPPSLSDPDLRQAQRRLLATHQAQIAHHPRRAQSWRWGWGRRRNGSQAFS